MENQRFLSGDHAKVKTANLFECRNVQYRLGMLEPVLVH